MTSTAESPIVLVGGMNGAGKTTLFESVVLCLYGISSLDGRITQKSYEAYLAKRVHRKGGIASHDGSSISVTFQISHAGKVSEYRVSRSWGTDGKSESLSIQSVDGDQLSTVDMDASGWQSFIDGLVPRGIARLFFFDGERIVRMVEEGESAVVKSSFDTLLGLDIVRQLRRDLEVNMMRNMKGGNAHIKSEFERLTAEKAAADERVARLSDRRASKQASLDSAVSDAKEVEATINALGGGFAARRAEIKAKRDAAAKLRDSIVFRIREMCGGSLPFAVIPEETAAVTSQIHDDRQLEIRSMTAAAIKEAAERAKERLYDDDVWDTLEDGSDLRSLLIPKMISAIRPPRKSASKRVFDLSREQEEQILSTIGNANGAATAALKNDADELIKTEEEIHRLDLALTSAPDDDEIGPMITKVAKTQSTLGMLEAEINHIDEEISSLRALSNHIQVKTRDVITQLYKDKKAGVRVELTKHVQLALDDYATKLADKKLALLETNLLEAILVLMHKKGLIDRVKVDRKTYAITLYKKDDIPVPKDSLSKGEQQMLTTAVLWALARTSGRPLPFMIDTPLARLDAGHRANLLERFFPVASHQVIIFSTDSEIGPGELEKLGPHVSRSYAIEYDAERDRTVPREGYFEEALQVAV